MKKFFVLLCTIAFFACMLCGCSSKVDYYAYISELRYDIYFYSGDSEEIKVYCSDREVPYSADGIKGEMNGIIEVYATFTKSYSAVSVDIGGTGGQMGYLSVKNCWYLSFTGGDFENDALDITVNCDGKEVTYTLLSVLSDGVMTGRQALDCTLEYDGETFERLTENGIFNGEIYIRLLYDDKCYYYVGVCDRKGNIKAWLADGETGRIIAEHGG